MPDFDTAASRYGEASLQALIETIERIEGICHQIPVSVEERWNTLMSKASTDNMAAA